MSLDYFIKTQTTGDNDTVSQVLTQNHLARVNKISIADFYSFDYPVYAIDEGASFDYYGKDYKSISYDITNGKIYTLIFTANTQSLSGNNSLSHNLYKIKLDEWNSFLSDPVNNGTQFSNLMNTPLVSIIEYFSALTINAGVYTYSFPTQYKDPGQFTQDIFEDKAQFFLDNPIGFDKTNDMTIGDAYYNDPNNIINGIQYPSRLYLEPSATTRVYSNYGIQTITGDTLASGYTFQGAFFSYFVPPKKPNLNVSLGRQQISVQGLQYTLSPIFNFNNTDDGDYYQLQVNYDVNDTPFSGSEIYNYTINKQAGDAEFVRTFSTPLRANDSFIYRIGNTKEITNVFGNKQNITTWSDTIDAEIVSTGRYSFSGTTWKNMASDTYFAYYHMSGLTVGAETPVSRTISVTTSIDGSIGSNSASATTNGLDTITVLYNGTVTTLQWQNAIYAAVGFSSMNMYVLGGSSSTSPINSTDFSFTMTTASHRFAGVVVQLSSVFLNTSLDLGIDLRTSRQVLVQTTTNYVNTTVNQQFTRVSDANGDFNFGNILGGYYLLTATPQPPPSVNSEYQGISTYVTVENDVDLDLIFSIYWNNDTPSGFDVLSNVTFL